MVFVLAAVIAISLYYELPRVMFERTREREQLLIDRGEQYSLAVRRFYVKFGRWPATMDQLENTNNMRFLRRQYKDPMTGEADWRIIHETAGVLTDSLVHPATQHANGQSGASGSSQTFGSLTSSQPFGSSLSSSSSNANADQPAPKAWGILSRPSDRGPLGDAHGGVTANDDTLPPAQGASSGPPGDASNANPAAGAPAGQNPGAANQAGGTGGAASAAPNSVVQQIQQGLTNPRQAPGATSGSNSSMPGGGAGIAGVASKSEMQGIKRYKDRSKYKEWEFVFDMTSLQQLQNPQGQQQQSQTQPGQTQPGQTPQAGQTQPGQTPQPQPSGGNITPVTSGNGP
jgi:hypothetical protein